MRFYEGRPVEPIDPAFEAMALTPHDTAEQPQGVRSIYVGAGGNLALRAVNSPADVTFANIPAGTVLQVRPKFIRASLTTAAQLVGLA